MRKLVDQPHRREHSPQLHIHKMSHSIHLPNSASEGEFELETVSNENQIQEISVDADPNDNEDGCKAPNHNTATTKSTNMSATKDDSRQVDELGRKNKPDNNKNKHIDRKEPMIDQQTYNMNNTCIVTTHTTTTDKPIRTPHNSKHDGHQVPPTTANKLTDPASQSLGRTRHLHIRSLFSNHRGCRGTLFRPTRLHPSADNHHVQEITSWFLEILGISELAHATAYAKTAVYQFGLHSAAEVEAQFGPPEYVDQEEWITVPHRKNYRTATVSIPKEDETNKTSNRFDALSDNESNTTASTEESDSPSSNVTNQMYHIII